MAGMPFFDHGVASGDPISDGVVLWTRVSGIEQRAEVSWWIGPSTDAVDAVARGTADARPDHDFTVHVDVRGLEPGCRYFYGFTAGDAASPVGRTRTAPVGALDRLRFGVTCCGSWVCGHFNAYGRLADRDVDVVLHLGDYTYEDDETRRKPVRRHDPPGRVSSLQEYRARHAQYRTDANLQRLHQRHPVIAVWDDHDLASDAWRDGAARHDPEDDGRWEERRDAGARAYMEWLPIRPPSEDPLRVYRSFTYGDLVDLLMIDARIIGRERPAHDGARAAVTIRDQRRSMLGDEQRSWLQERLRDSTASWRIVGNQVMLAPLRLLHFPHPIRRVAGRLGLVGGGAVVNPGQWDGFPAEREALLRFVRKQKISDVVVVTGDIHSSWAAEVVADPGADNAPALVEFVSPSVTTDSFAVRAVPSLPFAGAVVRKMVKRSNPHFPFFDLEGHGYLVVDVTPERVQADWWHVDTIREPSTAEHWAAGWTVRSGSTRLEPATAPTG